MFQNPPIEDTIRADLHALVRNPPRNLTSAAPHGPGATAPSERRRAGIGEADSRSPGGAAAVGP